MKRRTRTTCLALVFFCVTRSAMAQFAGDVFFAEPSVAAASGASVTLEIQVFTGATVAAGFHFDVEYNPDELTIEKIEPGSADEFQNVLSSFRSTGKLTIVTLNDQSLTEPFGTVSIAKVTVKVKAAAGATVLLDIKAKAFVNENSETMTTNGFSASIAVTSSASPGSKAKISDAPLRQDDSPAAKRLASKLRGRSHTKVKLWVVRRVGSEYIAEAVEVKTMDPNAPSD